MAEPLTVAAVQMMKAPAAAGPAAEEQQKMRASSRMVWTMKVRGPAVRQRGQMLEVAAVPLSLIMQKASLKQPQERRRPQKSTSTPPRCSHCPTWTVRIQRRSRRPSSTCLPAGWMKTLTSEGIQQLDKHDKMTCDHMDPSKEAKSPDLLGPPLDYMASCRVFEPKKTI